MRKIVRLDKPPQWSRGEIRFRLPAGYEIQSFVALIDQIEAWSDECANIGYVGEYHADHVAVSLFLDPGVRDWTMGDDGIRFDCVRCKGFGKIPYQIEGVS